MFRGRSFHGIHAQSGLEPEIKACLSDRRIQSAAYRGLRQKYIQTIGFLDSQTSKINNKLLLPAPPPPAMSAFGQFDQISHPPPPAGVDAVARIDRPNPKSRSTE